MIKEVFAVASKPLILRTGNFNRFGRGTADSLTNLVWWKDGSLLTLTVFPTRGSLAKINPGTCEETVIGATGLSFNAFDLGEVRGKLYLTDFSKNLYSADTLSGVATPKCVDRNAARSTHSSHL